jgi:hypothetical protein
MRREAITLVLAMFIGTVMMAACDKPEPRAGAPDRSKSAPVPNVEPSVPKVALGAPTPAERKEGTEPVAGEVDPKEPAQRRDFEQKKY